MRIHNPIKLRTPQKDNGNNLIMLFVCGIKIVSMLIWGRKKQTFLSSLNHMSASSPKTDRLSLSWRFTDDFLQSLLSHNRDCMLGCIFEMLGF